MHAKIAASAAVLGLSTLIAARPAPSGWQYTSSSKPYGSAGQEAFDFPLADGFPTVSPAEQQNINLQAHGEISDAAAPPSLAPETIVDNGFVFFNEIFEVAFFTELVYNITNYVPGYQASDIAPADRDSVLATLKVHLAQEELHVLNAQNVIKAFGSQVSNSTLQPCEYIFPVSTFNESITLATTFTDAVLSTLPDIQTIVADANNVAAIRGVGAVIGQEGEQNGFYRGLLGKPEAQLPFLTQGSIQFAFNAILQNFVVPGSCGNLDFLEKPAAGSLVLQEFDVLNLETSQDQLSVYQDTEVIFTLPGAKSNNPPQVNSLAAKPSMNATTSTESFFITYLNQVNTPISIPVTLAPADNNDGFQVNVLFPAQSQFLSGLTIAALTKGNTTAEGKPFATPDDVAAATIAGPALIEVEFPLTS